MYVPRGLGEFKNYGLSERKMLNKVQWNFSITTTLGMEEGGHYGEVGV